MPPGHAHDDGPAPDPGDSSVGYDLAPKPEPPPLPGDVVLRSTEDDVIDALAADLSAHAINCVREFGDFHLALSGDALLERLYLRLMYDPAFRALPWARTHLWLTHERAVEFDARESVFQQIREIIVDHSGIPPQQAHPIYALAEDAPERYEKELRETLVWREKGHDRLDFALLALREDGGLSGLSPGARKVGDGAFVERVDAPEGQSVVMTPRFLSAARFLGVMATGSTRRSAVSRIIDSGESESALPGATLRPMQGVMRWYVDEAARPAG